MSDLTSAAERVEAFRPLNGQVLVRLEGAHAAYTGMLVIPDSIEADINGTRLARVIAVGPGRKAEGSASARCLMSVKVGERVILDEICLRGAWPVIAPGYHVVEEEQILGAVEE